jgi:hypothetical protein
VIHPQVEVRGVLWIVRVRSGHVPNVFEGFYEVSVGSMMEIRLEEVRINSADPALVEIEGKRFRRILDRLLLVGELSNDN